MPSAPDLDQLFRLGYDRLYAGDFTAAARGFQAVVAADPTNGEAWAALADAFGGIADGTAAAASALAFGRAVALDPTGWSWRLSHAEALLRCGNFDAAHAIYAALTAERSDSAPARLGLARCLSATGHKEEALDEFREAVALRPDDRDAALALAEALTEAGDALAAVELLQPLAHRFDDDAAVHQALGRGWLALQEPVKALAALRHARALADGDDAFAIERLITALEAGEGADLSAAYVRALFDRYADRFDQDLVGKLGYAAPELLRAAVDRLGGPAPAAGSRVLDLGCGTGLAGVVFRSLAGHLAGVDLSPRMVEKARQRGLYDALGVGDVVDAMAPGSGDALGAWDLLVAADVLVYIGDLAPVFAAAARALVPGGRFAATVERLPDESPDPIILGATRRYAHTQAYVRDTAAAAGFTIRLIEPCAPRREKGVPVAGLLFVVERPAT
ncbi:tetratricopeptide repeat protein [Azospirillum sp. TSO35-2]|uniref:tetratricopeptide repeat protein n=1 Tax=Azospirillum sp. TSO35-2 TaxID=716796 RepID=UPI001FFF5872|nr:tetratricopeptide repeat protein [Azospirillum sp. TSO35-2]